MTELLEKLVILVAPFGKAKLFRLRCTIAQREGDATSISKLFLQAAAGSGIKEGYIIEVKIVTDEGKTMCTNVKLTESDMELFRTLKEVGGSVK